MEKGRQPTPVLLPGESLGQRSLVGCSPWDCKESGRHWTVGSRLISREMWGWWWAVMKWESKHAVSPTCEPPSCQLSKTWTCVPLASGMSEIAARLCLPFCVFTVFYLFFVNCPSLFLKVFGWGRYPGRVLHQVPLSESRARLVPSPGYRLTLKPRCRVMCIWGLRVQHIVRSQVRRMVWACPRGDRQSEDAGSHRVPLPRRARNQAGPYLLGSLRTRAGPGSHSSVAFWRFALTYLLLERSAGVTHMEGSLEIIIKIASANNTRCLSTSTPGTWSCEHTCPCATCSRSFVAAAFVEAKAWK